MNQPIQDKPDSQDDSGSRSPSCYPSIDVPLHWLLEQVREANEYENEAAEKKMYVTASSFAGRAEAFQELIDEYKKENP